MATDICKHLPIYHRLAIRRFMLYLKAIRWKVQFLLVLNLLFNLTLLLERVDNCYPSPLAIHKPRHVGEGGVIVNTSQEHEKK